MTDAQFLAGLTGSDRDFHLAVEALRASGRPFCLIGGLAFNHYVEPAVTLDANFVVAAGANVVDAFRSKGFLVTEHPHSLSAELAGSRLRVQITINSRYGAFLGRAVEATIFGEKVPVACIEDLVQGKLWALQDADRRASKRAKDRADLIRLYESHPRAADLIPNGLAPEVDELRNRS